MTTNNKTFDHISAEGNWAGHPICDTVLTENQKNCHLPYVPDLDGWANEHIKCQNCIDILKEAGE